MTEDDRRAAEERNEFLRHAHNFETLLEHPGWKAVYAAELDYLNALTNDLRSVDTGKLDIAVNALQKWQIASELLERKAGLINQTLEHANTLKSGLTLDEVYIMEQLRNEQPQPASRPADSAGY